MGLFTSGAIASTSISAGTATATQPSITATPAVEILAASTGRTKFLIFNPPTNTATIYVMFGAVATVANGLPLTPGQGWLEEGYRVHTGIVSAISAGGSQTIKVWEWQ